MHGNRQKHIYKSSKKNGFTLIELLVVLFITAIVFAIGTANLRDFQRRKEIDGVVEQLRADLELLRAYSLSGKSECPDSVRYYRWHLAVGPNAPGYVLRLVCDPSGGPNLKTVDLPDDYTITSTGIGPEGSIFYLPLGQGLQNSDPVLIEISAPDGTTRTVVVSTNGTIE